MGGTVVYVATVRYTDLEMSIHLLLVDGLNLVRRVYAAHPGDDGPERAEGAIASTSQSLERGLRECHPSHAVCVFEGEGPSWRHQVFDRYKEGHAPMPEALHESLPRYRRAFAEMGVASFSMPNTEADDVIATLASKAAAHSSAVTILSTDKIFLQLLSPRIRVRDHFNRRDLDRAYMKEKFGVAPERFVDYLALAGDSTNSIPGVPGIGPKTAAKLLAERGSLDEILSTAESIEGKLGERLRTHMDEALLSESLVRLSKDLDLGLNLQDLRWAPPPQR